MRVLAMWYGGSSYAWGDLSDLEPFASVAEAKRELAHRASGSDSYYPCVDSETTCMDLYCDPLCGMAEPFARLTLGPRGGVQMHSM